MSSLSSSARISRDSYYNSAQIAAGLSALLDKAFDEDQVVPLLELVLQQRNTALQRHYGCRVMIPTNPEDPWVCWLMNLRTAATAALTLYQHETKGIRVLGVTAALNRSFPHNGNMLMASGTIN